MASERIQDSRRVRGFSARLPFVRRNPLGLELFLTFIDVPPLSSRVSLSILSSWHSSCIAFYDSYIHTNIWCARDLCGSAYEIALIHRNTKGGIFFYSFWKCYSVWQNLKKKIKFIPKLGSTPWDVPPLIFCSSLFLATSITRTRQVLALCDSIRPFPARPKLLFFFLNVFMITIFQNIKSRSWNALGWTFSL